MIILSLAENTIGDIHLKRYCEIIPTVVYGTAGIEGYFKECVTFDIQIFFSLHLSGSRSHCFVTQLCIQDKVIHFEFSLIAQDKVSVIQNVDISVRVEVIGYTIDSQCTVGNDGYRTGLLNSKRSHSNTIIYLQSTGNNNVWV